MLYNRRTFAKISMSIFAMDILGPVMGQPHTNHNRDLVPGPVVFLAQLEDMVRHADIQYFFVLNGGAEDGLYEKKGAVPKLLKNTGINLNWIGGMEPTASIKAIINLNQTRETNYSIYIPTGEWAMNEEFTCSGQVFWGEGTLVPVLGQNNYIMNLVGNGNTVVGLGFLEKSFCKVLLQIDGSDNEIKDCSFVKTNPSSSSKVVYSDKLLHVKSPNGKNNWIDGCDFRNGRIGAALEGNYTVTKCTVTGCITGLLLRPSSNGSTVSHNKILDNNVNHASGADGILAQRNVTKLHIHHNEISGSGEHGIYLQGDNCLLEENTITKNYRSGIKLASYNTNLYQRPEMRTEFYVGHHNTIRNNNCRDNSQDPKDTSNAGIYLQAPLTDILVEGNDCSGNNYGIRSTSLAKLTKEEMATKGQLRKLKFIDNKALDTRRTSFYVEGETGVEVLGNEMDSMLTNAKEASEKISGILIRDNIIHQKLTLNRARAAVVTKNKIGSVVVVSNSKNGGHTIQDNK